MGDSKWWQTNPCPLHPDWGLRDICDLDYEKLKQTIDKKKKDDGMVVEILIYRAFLAYPKWKGKLYNQTRNSPSEADDYLRQAEEYTRDSLCRNSEDAKTGYGIVINTFRMWIKHNVTCESILKKLEMKKKQYPGHQAYVDAVHAYILSRLGPIWRESAIYLYKNALRYFPEQCHWLFGIALMIGRKARQRRTIVGGKGPLPDNIRELFTEEEQLLKRVLEIKPTFHLARAYYGQVLYYLDKSNPDSENEFRKAFNESPDNIDISILVAKLYKVKRSFQEAEKILLNLLNSHENVKIAEVHCQLGCIYRSQSYGCEEFTLKALHQFERAVELDNCHYPALALRAELNAQLGNKDTARNMYGDLFEGFTDTPHQVSNEYKALLSALKLKPAIFEPLQYIKLSHRFIEIIALFTADSDDVLWVPRKSLENSKNIQLSKLNEYSKESDLDVRREAKFKFANAKLLLQQIDEATYLYDQLYKVYAAFAEVIFYRGKCYFHKGNEADNEQAAKLWESVIQMAEELSKIDGRDCRFSSDELYGDVHLARAKASEQSSSDATSGTNLETWEQLGLAIQSCSLEACYDYMSRLQILKENFFLNDIPHGRIPQTLSEIQYVCEINKPLHTKFTATLRDDSQVVNDVAAKKNFILSLVDEVIKYDVIISPDSARERLSSISLQLKELRENRLQYEVELRRSKTTGVWGKPYRKTLSGVTVVARQILDNCISTCQSVLMKKAPDYSIFLVMKPGMINKEKCEREVRKTWKKKVFPDINMPDGFLRRIIEIQPTYNEENIWLWALHSFNNLEKHSPSKCDAGETFTVPLYTNLSPRKTEVIVKESCQGVTNLVVDLINMCFVGAKSEV